MSAPARVRADSPGAGGEALPAATREDDGKFSVVLGVLVAVALVSLIVAVGTLVVAVLAA